MSPAVRSGRIVIAAETKGMQNELQRFTGLPVSLSPHPVEFRRPSDTLTSVSLGQRHPLTVTCPGFARHEKGSDLLQGAIRILFASQHRCKFRFVLQWPKPFEMPDQKLMGPSLELLSDKRVEFLNRNLSPEEYTQLLDRTDLIVLPYRRCSYHHRVSRVAIEAAGHGIPIIYTEGTWAEEVASLADCGISIHSESAEEVATAILNASERVNELRFRARAGAFKVSNYHSVATFAKMLRDLKKK